MDDNFNKIQKLRKELDDIDKELILKLKQRNNIVLELSKHKKNKQLDIHQKKRWEESSKLRYTLSEQENVNPKLTKEIFDIIHQYSINLQKDI